MKNLYFILSAICLQLCLFITEQSFAQTKIVQAGYTQSEYDSHAVVDSGVTQPAETVFGEDGSVQFSTETVKLLNDPAYRAGKYPSAYSLTHVPGLLEKGDLTFALWTLMNVYESNQEQVRTIVFMLGDRGVQASHYLNAFYTYVFTDPEIFAFPEGQEPFLQYPLRLEEKLESCRTLAVYTDKFLKMKSEAK